MKNAAEFSTYIISDTWNLVVSKYVCIFLHRPVFSRPRQWFKNVAFLERFRKIILKKISEVFLTIYFIPSMYTPLQFNKILRKYFPSVCTPTRNTLDIRVCQSWRKHAENVSFSSQKQFKKLKNSKYRKKLIWYILRKHRPILVFRCSSFILELYI